MVYDHYDLYLSAEDLKGKTVNVKVSGVKWKPFYNKKTKQDEMCAVLSFEGKYRKLILNRGQADDVTRATGEDTDENKWVGHFISISPVKGYSGKTTIKVTKPIRAEGLFGAAVGKNVPAQVKA